MPDRAVAPTALEHELLRELALDNFGLDLPTQRRTSLGLRLQPRLVARGLASFAEYYRLLRGAPLGTEEWGQFADAVTNSETYFFRGPGQFDELIGVLPKLAGRRLRALSVGCASGEEAYSIAAVLAGQGAALPHGFDVIGADISTPRLAEACIGRYDARSLRGARSVPGAGGIDEHFERDRDHWSPRPLLRARVTFHPRNLAAPSGLQLGRFDVIFCRNVLIYTHRAHFQRFVESLAASLAPGGYLFVGETETLLGPRLPFTAQRLRDRFAYVLPS